MNRNMFARHCISALVAASFGAAATQVMAAPTISRLTPPSNPLSATATTLARFLPGQRFDLQTTVQPETGATVKSVTFAVDGATVATINHDGTANNQFSGNASLVKTGLVSGLATNTVVASVRAYSNVTAGVHKFTATAIDSNGATTVKEGNFEVVAILANNGRPAKNVIVLLGDGMGAAHRTAARIVAKGYAQGKAQDRLAMDTFPVTGMVMTASLNSIVTDSAPGMANYVNGNKAQNNQEGVFPDDTSAAFDNPRVEYLSEYLHRTKGTSLGIVTTADVFDATPAANAVHTSARGNGTGIVDQYLDDRNLTGLKVLLGGGRKWFLPTGTLGSQRASGSDYVMPADISAGWGAATGAIDTGRDLIADFTSAGYAYAPDNSTLQSLGTPDKLLGLFSYSNMNVSYDKINGRRGASTVAADYGFPDQPMLDEMAQSALKVLNKNNTNGFVLMIEGASIDKQAHAMDSDRWIEEVIEFDRAVQKAKDFATQNPDTIVIVTADHECSGAALIGALKDPAATPSANSVAVYDAASFPKYTMNADGYPQNVDIKGKLVIGYGSNADRYETWLANPLPTKDSQQPLAAPAGTPASPQVQRNPNVTGYLVTGQVGADAGGQATHTASDIPLSAYGRGAMLFTGVMDNTDVFFKLGQIAIGGAK